MISLVRFSLALIVLLFPGLAGAASAASSDAAMHLPLTSRDGGVSSNPGVHDLTTDALPADARPNLPSWAPKLSATVKPANAQIGDPIQVTIVVKHGKGISVNLPLKLNLGKFSELSREETMRDSGKVQGQIADVEQIFTLRVAAYELGEQILAPIEITAIGPRSEMMTLATEPIPIRIQSVLRNEPNPKLKNMEPPISVFQRSWWLLYILIAIAAIGIIAATTLLINRQLRARQERLKPPPPPVPAHVVALKRLSSLDIEAYISKKQFKELYLALSEIIREYVGRRWGFDALEMTTTEINDTLASRLVAVEFRHRFDVYFNQCDLVKFAKYQPEAEIARQTFRDAETLVKDTAHFDLKTSAETDSAKENKMTLEEREPSLSRSAQANGQQ